jgi:hypothetical protein
LAHLLRREGVQTRLMSEHEGSTVTPETAGDGNFKAVCLCYLDAGNIHRARYVLRRVRRRFADAQAFAAVFDSSGLTSSDLASASTGYRLVTSLEEAVRSILSCLNDAKTTKGATNNRADSTADTSANAVAKEPAVA